MTHSRRLLLGFSFAVLLALVAIYNSPRSQFAGQSLPEKLSDSEFWSVINECSEPGGYFRSDNFVSNESTFQRVIPELYARTRPGGIYLGVGPDQNFTYIAAMHPKFAFIVDIRRQNLLEHLMYKALFEMSDNRADFLSKLFARPLPPRLPADTSTEKLFEIFNNEETDQALAKYQQSLGVDDEFAQTYLLLGDLYQSKQEPDKAIQAYQSAAKYDESAANNALGNFYINRQEWDNAAGVYQKILEKDPNNLQAHSALGLIYSRQSKWDQAINENLIVASRQPNDLSSLRNLALLYQQVGKYAEALQYAQRALAVTPDNEKPQIQALIQQLQQQLQGKK